MHTLQGMIRSRLRGRACKTAIGLGHYMALHAEGGLVSFLHLQLSLRKFRISLTAEVKKKSI